jgi:predicted regulator of Ras-like GTPase activity (Roadblock/LC7/MglB family)
VRAGETPALQCPAAGEISEGNVENALQRLMAISGVTGALLAGKDGVVRASTLPHEEAELLGAMAAAAFDAANRYISQLNAGGARHALFETPSGAVQVADAGDALIVVRSSQAALGRVRLELLRATGQLARRPGGR